MTANKSSVPEPTAEAVLAVVAGMYDAALDERLWPEALERLTRLTGSQAATFWVLDPTEASLLHPTFVSVNFDRKAVSEYLAGMARLDPTVRYLVAHPREPIVHDGMLGDGRDEETRKYLDWHERSVETRFRLVGQSDPGLGLQAGVALHRARRVGRYQPDEISRFAMLHEHLRRALAIGARLGSLASMRQLSTDLLDRGGVAVVLLDSRRRVVFLNRAAEELQARGDGVQVSREGIRLANGKEDSLLQYLIAQAVDSLQRSGRATGEVMRVSRTSCGRPYGVWVTAVSRPPVVLTQFRPAVCVLISDPDRQTGPAVANLQKLFKMTLAEARLAAHLANGVPLRSAAHRLGITYGTARSRLTQVFEKTSTRSQSALVRLLLTVINRI